jgi:hypothetical protein
MSRHTIRLTMVALALSCGTIGAQEPATPTTIIENPETRIVRVDILASSTRSMHNHPDMNWHVFVTMDAPIVLTIQGQEANPVKLGPWQSHFFRGGVTHAITNPSPKPVQFLEFFSKKAATAASNDPVEERPGDGLETAMRSLPLSLARVAADGSDQRSVNRR